VQVAKSEQNEDETGISKRNMTFIDLLLTDEHVYTTRAIKNEVNTFMFAVWSILNICPQNNPIIFKGHDTVSLATSWTLFMMANHPEIQNQVVEELDQVFGDSGRAPSMDDLAELKCLERCIKETLRLYPSIAFFERYIREDIPLDCI
jgi:hypothetical protein